MTKNQKKQTRTNVRAEKKTNRVQKTSALYSERIKDMSKKFIHDYVLPMTKTLENRLHRLEQSL